jgi:hypothetical protein
VTANPTVIAARTKDRAPNPRTREGKPDAAEKKNIIITPEVKRKTRNNKQQQNKNDS